jgi:hypothetical protein
MLFENITESHIKDLKDLSSVESKIDHFIGNVTGPIIHQQQSHFFSKFISCTGFSEIRYEHSSQELTRPKPIRTKGRASSAAFGPRENPATEQCKG